MMKIKTKSVECHADVNERSPLIVPIELERFANSFSYKHAQGLFLGNVSHERESSQRSQFSRTRRMARSLLEMGLSMLEPTQPALNRTEQAAIDFFTLSFKFLNKNNMIFPLADHNKCLGMVVVPTTNLVMIAISQDKEPQKDAFLRQQMVDLLNKLNTITKAWTFELACIPTKSQYLMPRTLLMRTPHVAPQEWVNPHTRCVEVALMVALCKAGRHLTFTSADTGIMTYGGTLWASRQGSESIPRFEGKVRNIKYVSKAPVEIRLTDSISGWLDVWDPCGEHCKIYKYEMLAIGSAGGPATSFTEPRSEWDKAPLPFRDNQTSVEIQSIDDSQETKKHSHNVFTI
jgi:hypothetical protein